MNIRQILADSWGWLKSRQKMTLLAGAIIGALFDDVFMNLVGFIF